MPNWCYTYYTINSEHTEKLKQLYENMEKWLSHNYIDNGFGDMWLGNIVGNSGLDSFRDGNSNVSCRGTVSDFELSSDTSLTISTETAWGPMNDIWIMLCDRFLPEYELIFESEESGEDYYGTNDPTIKGKYKVDCYEQKPLEASKGIFSDDYEPMSEEIVRKGCKTMLGIENDELSTDELIQLVHDRFDGISISKWEYEELECSMPECNWIRKETTEE